MATCGDCTYFTSCFNSHEQPNNEDHEICGRYVPTVEDVLREFGDWYAHTKGGCDEDGIIAEYAAKLRLAEGRTHENEFSRSDLEHPKRYVHGSVECFDMLEAALSPREVIGFYKGCILKYIWRERDKGGWYDLQKAEVYARRLNEFCARIGLSGDVPQDASTECAADTD
jgi:hypothetical protein